MKKLIIAMCAVALGLAAPAACTWDWWFGNADKDIQGCALGLGSANKDVVGAQISVCASKAENVKAGCQSAIGYSEVKTLRNGCPVRLRYQGRQGGTPVRSRLLQQGWLPPLVRVLQL